MKKMKNQSASVLPKSIYRNGCLCLSLYIAKKYSHLPLYFHSNLLASHQEMEEKYLKQEKNR